MVFGFLAVFMVYRLLVSWLYCFLVYVPFSLWFYGLGSFRILWFRDFRSCSFMIYLVYSFGVCGFMVL